MVSEKTPTLYLTKVPLEHEQTNEKVCSRTAISWFIAAILVTLVVVISIEFFYPVDNERFKTIDDFRVFEDQPIDVRLIPPVTTDRLPEEKKSTTRNPWDFNFVIDPTNLCMTKNSPNSYQYQEDPEIKLLVLVPSMVDHFKQRKAIRNTWGSIAEKPLGPMRLGFVLGTSGNTTVSDLVQEESSRYRDIIQADFVEDYHLLTTKSVLMLKWVAKSCPHAKYFLKADDDTFINVLLIEDILDTEPFASEKKFIRGHVSTGAQPTRTPEAKYYVSESYYPFEEYPPYVSGSAYVMTGPTAIELFDASKEVEPLLPMEDVFLTGLCAEHIDAPRIHDPRFRFEDPPKPPSWDAFSPLASARSLSPDDLEAVWNDMNQSVLSVFNQLFNQKPIFNTSVSIRVKSKS